MYEQKSTDYFTHTRMDIVAALNGKVFKNVLELGAGGCDTLIYLKKNGKATTVTGIELFEIPNSNQQHSDLDVLHIASIEKIQELPLKTNFYNLVICGDVLEHVFDPWSVLRFVKSLLTNDGMVICSIPNIREFATMKKIFLQGNFAYDLEGGILDKTHVRFFCKKNIIDLFVKSGYTVNSIEPAFNWAPSQKNRKLANNISLGLFEGFLTYQYIVKATRN